MKIFRLLLIVVCLIPPFSGFAKRNIKVQEKENKNERSIEAITPIEAWLEDSSKEIVFQFYCNLGPVIIGGEIHSFKDLQNYNDYKTANGNTMSGPLEDQEITVFADEIVINQCGLTSNHKKRKFHVKSNWDSLRGCVAFSLNASSKFLWGWKALSTKYYCTGLGPQYKPLWETNEIPSGSTYWVPNFPRSGDFYIYTRSFGPEGRQLLRVRV